jgi:hypothetical protein
MPPPPPPSKSYNIIIVDSDDEDSEPEYQQRTQQRTSNVPNNTYNNNNSNGNGNSNSYRYANASNVNVNANVSSAAPKPVVNNAAPRPVESPVDDNDNDNDVYASASDVDSQDDCSAPDADTSLDGEEENGVTDSETQGSPRSTIPSSNSAKNAKRRKRKKKKRKGSSGQSSRRVNFGSVSVLEFGRCLGTDTVPSDGGWPLGMTMSTITDNGSSDVELISTEEALSIDDYETEKQARLHARLKGLELESVDGGVETDPAEWLETRQRDYKYKSKNKLFRMMTETERMVLLLADSSDVPDGDGVGSTMATPLQEMMYTRARSGSMDKKSQTRSRSGSIEKKPPQAQVSRTRSASFAEQYNDTYTQVEVHHVRNELETLRNSRSKEGNTGCTCRKLDVYLLPPGGGGKKAHSRRMNERKVKEELRKRHLLPQESKTREELEILLHDTVEKEPCCLDDCACVRDGIECQADTCKCWYTSHQSEKGKKHDDIPSIEKINSRCGNRFGIYTVDPVKIDDFRSSYICVEIKS